MLGTSTLAILVFSISSFHFWHSYIIAHNIKYFWENCGDVTPSAKGLFPMTSHIANCSHTVIPTTNFTWYGTESWRSLLMSTKSCTIPTSPHAKQNSSWRSEKFKSAANRWLIRSCDIFNVFIFSSSSSDCYKNKVGNKHFLANNKCSKIVVHSLANFHGQ